MARKIKSITPKQAVTAMHIQDLSDLISTLEGNVTYMRDVIKNLKIHRKTLLKKI